MTWSVLTVRQPWALAIVLGHKTIENRSSGFSRSFRGRLHIHSAMAWSSRGQRDERMLDAFDGCDPESNPLRGASWANPFLGGCIIGSVEVVDVHPEQGCCRPWGESEYVEAGGRTRCGLVHLILEDPEVLEVPVPVKGRLGIWKIERGVLS